MLLIIYVISVLSLLQCSYCLNNRMELRYFVISFVPFAPAQCVMCQFIFKLLFSQTLNILFEMSLLFRITVKQTAIISCVMIVMITFWTKYISHFFSCLMKPDISVFLHSLPCNHQMAAQNKRIPLPLGDGCSQYIYRNFAAIFTKFDRGKVFLRLF